MARERIVRRLLVSIALCVLASASRGFADLSWFDGARSRPTPLTLAELVAWGDAGLDWSAEEWQRAVAIHGAYLDAWQRDAGSGANADARLVVEFAELIGEDARRRAVLRTMGALQEARATLVTRLDYDFAALRRRVLALAARGREADPIAFAPVADAIARAAQVTGVTEEHRFGDPFAITKALREFRPQLEAAFGAEATEDFLASLAVSLDRMPMDWTEPRFEALLRKANRLSDAERRAALDALAAARSRWRAMLGGSIDTGQTLWFDAKSTIERELAARLRAALGEERATAVERSASLYWDPADADMTADESNAAADRRVSLLMDDAAAEALARETGGRFWHPVELLGHMWDDAEVLKLPVAWSTTLAGACFRTPPSADELAVIAELLDAHRARVAELRAETRLDRRDAIAAYVRRMLEEDGAVIAALGAAIPEERLDAEAIALVRLARVETGVPLASGGTVVPGIGWVQFPVQTGSLALLALGMQQQQAPLPGRDAIAAVRRALAPLARNHAEAWVSDWNRWIGETAALAAEHGGRLPPGAEGPITATRLQGPIERTRALVGALRSGDGPHTAVAEAVAAVVSVTRRPVFPPGVVASERLRDLLERPVPEDVRAAAIARLQSASDPASDPLAEDLELLRLVARLDREDPPIDRLARVANAWRSREALAQARLGVATVEAWRMLRAAGVEDARIAFIP